MRINRAAIGAAMLAMAAMVAAHGAAAQRMERLPEECRSPKLRLCLVLGAEARQQCALGAIQELPDSCRKLISERAAMRAGPLPAGWREARFGSDPRQSLDWVLPADVKGKVPVLLFIHGGGWSIGDKRMAVADKAAHFTAKGWAFASTNYRLVPQATVEQQAADVAAAVALLRQQSGVDPDRIVLMGHSAGAHLAALVATDPNYLAAAGVPLRAVRGVVLLDGAGYDVVQQMANPRNRVQTMYTQAFSTDPKRQAALSPQRHAASPNAGAWLILPVAGRKDSVAQSEGLAAAVRAGGATARVAPQAGKTHASLNKQLGAKDDPATAEVDRFLAGLR